LLALSLSHSRGFRSFFSSTTHLKTWVSRPGSLALRTWALGPRCMHTQTSDFI
jgi:hypothetical protein